MNDDRFRTTEKNVGHQFSQANHTATTPDWEGFYPITCLTKTQPQIYDEAEEEQEEQEEEDPVESQEQYSISSSSHGLRGRWLTQPF